MIRIFTIFVAIVVTIIVVGVGLIGSTGDTEPGESGFYAVAFSIGVLVLNAWSEKRVRADLGLGGRATHATSTAVAGAATGRRGGLSGLAVSGATRGSMDLTDLLAAFLSAGLVMAALGWWADWQSEMAWPVGIILGALSGFAMARRIGAWQRVDLRIRSVQRYPVTPTPIALGAFGAGAICGSIGWYIAGYWLGGVEGPTVLAVTVMVGIAGWLGTEAVQTRRMRGCQRPISSTLAAVLGIMDGPMEQLLHTWTIDKAGTITMRPPLAAPVLARMDGIHDRVVSIAPDWEVVTASAADGVVIRGATEATQAARALMAATEGMVTKELPAKESVVRPGHTVWMLAPNVTKTHAPRLAELAREQRGMEMVAYHPEKHRAHLAAIDKNTVDARRRVAEVMGVADESWRVEVAVDWNETAGCPDRVAITRMPASMSNLDKREVALKTLAHEALRGSNPGWHITALPQEGRAVLKWGPRPVLPSIVPLVDLLPSRLAPDQWANLPLGIGADGGRIGIDLKAGPHALVAGPTGSGKSVGLLTLVTGALARGHKLVVIDPTKAGLDFMSLKPWCTGWADELDEAKIAIEKVYEEGMRRKKILKREGRVSWDKVPADVRTAEGLVPMTVLIDEFGSAGLEASVSKSLDKEDKLVVEANEQNAARATLKMYAGKIARELRFVGIFLQIALQRPDAKFLGDGEVRSNLTSRVQLSKPGSAPDRDALNMVFEPEAIESAREQIHLLDDGRSKGLGTVAAEGGKAKSLRVGYAEMPDVPALLKAIGVPRATEVWDLTSPMRSWDSQPVSKGRLLPDPFAAVNSLEDEPEVVDLGTTEITLDDLDISLDELEDDVSAPVAQPTDHDPYGLLA